MVLSVLERPFLSFFVLLVTDFVTIFTVNVFPVYKH